MSEATTPRRQQKEERREQILDAALHVFSQKGFAGASIRDIAREVGVTEGLLYHYFDSKEQLLNACWKERTWRASLERILADGAGKPVETVLGDLITDFLSTLRENSEMVRVCAAEMQRNAEMKTFHLQRIEDNHQLICRFLEARQEAGEIRTGIDAGSAAGILMGAAYSLFLLYGDQSEEVWAVVAGGLASQGVDVVMNGLLPAQAL